MSKNTVCTRCGIVPDEILVLLCNHDLCLDCASKILRREQAKSHLSIHVIQ